MQSDGREPRDLVQTRELSRRSLLKACAALAPALLGVDAGAWAYVHPPDGSFQVEGDHFVFRGERYQVIAGEMHYARIPREYWGHRIRMAKAMGLNTIATYVFWNVHEPRPGTYDFSGNADIAEFIRMVQAEGLQVLLRAGPYSCAEWEFGGFPAWLLKDPRMQTALRTKDEAFMVPAARWIARLAEETAPLLLAHGGPILAVQVENEYGNFGNESGYMQGMLKVFQGTGYREALLYTVDPSKALARGMLDGILSGVNFGTGNAEHGLAALAALRPGQPLFATEYWPGWFDLWGHPHETRPMAPQLKDIEYVLSHGASINIYVFHGGTNFAMWPGASASTGMYRGNTTSYDYDAPLDESGHTTPKYFAYRDLILKYTKQPQLPVPEGVKVVAVPEFQVRPETSLWDCLPQPLRSEQLLTMEQVDQAFGYMLYRKQMESAIAGKTLVIDPVHDFVQVFFNRKLVGTLDRHYNQTTVTLTTEGPGVLELLVENTGRLNSTRNMRNEWKGMKTAVLDGTPLTGWEIYPLPMNGPWLSGKAELKKSGGAADKGSGPHFARGSFTLSERGDAFLDVSALGKGLIWINGHALGRFWNIGPQVTLYVPGPWLKQGSNEVALFELFAADGPKTLVGRLKPMLDGPTPGYAEDPERKKRVGTDAEFGPKLAAPAPSAVPATPPVRPKE